MTTTKGLVGQFKSPIEGDNTDYQLKIYKDYLNGEIEDMTLYDYNESYQMWRCDKPNKYGYTGVIVKMRQFEEKTDNA